MIFKPKGNCDPCCTDWKAKINELWQKYQGVVKGVRAGGQTAYPDGDGIANLDNAVASAVSQQINIALDDYIDEDELTDVLDDYQTKLESGVSIKTINNTSLLGSGNIEIQGGGGGAPVDWDDIQDKPTFATVATSGDYDDLIDKPSLATVATTGDYDDLTNKPTIPDAQIQSDWTQADNTKVDYIKNKPDLSQYLTSVSWGDIGGSLANQTDLNTELSELDTFMTNAKSRLGCPYGMYVNTGQTAYRSIRIHMHNWNGGFYGYAPGVNVGTINGSYLVCADGTGESKVPTNFTLSNQDLSNTNVGPANAGKYLKVASDGKIEYEPINHNYGDILSKIISRIDINGYLNDNGSKTTLTNNAINTITLNGNTCYISPWKITNGPTQTYGSYDITPYYMSCNLLSDSLGTTVLANMNYVIHDVVEN